MNTPRRNLAELYREVAAGKRHEKAELRQLVLGFPDLAQRLTELPWPFSAPDRWSGHVPPYLFDGVRNNSPQRTALIGICREAIARKHGEEIAGQWLAAMNNDPDAPSWNPHQAADRN